MAESTASGSKTKVGKIPIWVIVAAGVGGLYLLVQIKNKNQTPAASVAAAAPTSGTGAQPGNIFFLPNTVSNPGQVGININPRPTNLPPQYSNPAQAGSGSSGGFWYQLPSAMYVNGIAMTAYGIANDQWKDQNASIASQAIINANPQINWSVQQPAGTLVYIPDEPGNGYVPSSGVVQQGPSSLYPSNGNGQTMTPFSSSTSSQ